MTTDAELQAAGYMDADGTLLPHVFEPTLRGKPGHCDVCSNPRLASIHVREPLRD